MVGNWVSTGNDAQRLGGQLRAAITQLGAAANTLAALKNVMAQMVASSDYTTIEAEFGVPAGSGQTLHDVLGTASDTLQASDVQALLQRFA